MLRKRRNGNGTQVKGRAKQIRLGVCEEMLGGFEVSRLHKTSLGSRSRRRMDTERRDGD